MKTLIAAIALTIAAPAFAQTADPHAGHTQGQHEDHEQHKGCCEGKDGARMECCEKMMKDGKKMACCDKDAEKGDAHAGHDMSQH